MEDKNSAYLADIQCNNGQQDETVVGESIGLAEPEIEQIIKGLLKEGRIEHQSFEICSYRLTGR
ncbi:hypothetical protein [Hymenobacter lapidiphilus]|uniref:hypothetical protein n=1 Tax=Hymenobacter sp. CCM 8763 TaxID=2303334 RepID=UPI0011C163DE|nr:hypothetical protein [Hymenobacter sp. CCM 8763]